MKCKFAMQALTQLVRAPMAVLAADAACWDATVQAVTAVSELLKILLAADASACPAALRDGSWDVGGVHDVMCVIYIPHA